MNNSFPFFKIREEKIQLANDQQYSHFSLDLKADAVMTLGITKGGYFLVNQEYRHSVDSTIHCCPGGLIEKGETPIKAAKRELLEETGYSSDNFALMGEAFPFPGICSQKIFYFLAQDIEKVAEPNLEPGEDIQSTLLKKEEIKQLLLDGDSIDGIMGTAFFFYLMKMQ